MIYKHTEKQLNDAVNKSSSLSQVCNLLGIKPAGGNYKTLKLKLKEFNINYNHFTGQAWNTKENPLRVNGGRPRKNIDDILTNKTVYNNTHALKNRLINEGYKDNKCESCKLTKWMDKQIPLELHHKDGNRFNNLLSNIQILCSNCHGQTDNYCSKNMKSFKCKKES